MNRPDDRVPDPVRHPGPIRLRGLWDSPLPQCMLGTLAFLVIVTAFSVLSVALGGPAGRWLRWSCLLVPALIVWEQSRAVPEKRAIRRPGWFALGAYWIPALVLLLWCWIRWSNDWSLRREFDVTAWHASPPVRQWMTDDLIGDRTLIGRTRDDVLALLGAPDESDEGSLRWFVGSGRMPLDMCEEWLVVVLGSDGRVLEARIDQIPF